VVACLCGPCGPLGTSFAPLGLSSRSRGSAESRGGERLPLRSSTSHFGGGRAMRCALLWAFCHWVLWRAWAARGVRQHCMGSVCGTWAGIR